MTSATDRSGRFLDVDDVEVRRVAILLIHGHSDRPSTSHRRRAAALRHAIRPAVCLRLAVGRAGLLPDRPRTERAANRTVADADTRWRHHRLALPHDSR